MFQDKYLLHERQAHNSPEKLRTIALDVTNRCNMSCSHCYASVFKHQPDVDLDFLRRFTQEAYELGVFHYVLQGGEAILEFDRLKSIIEMIHPKETYINVVSNGWAMDRAAIRELKALDVDKVSYSLDSGFAEEHDSNRMLGSFERVIEAVKNTTAEGLHSAVSTVVSHKTIEQESFKKVLEIGKELQVRVEVQVAMPVGRWDGIRDIRITPNEAAHLKEIFETRGMLPNGQRHIGRDVYDCNGTDYCPAGQNFMAVSACGEIFPCNFCQYTLGNIKDTSLADARAALLTSKWFQGTHPCCLLGEDDEFFDKYVAPNVEREKPLDAYKLFDLKV
ncbi:radical SAM/SPASM domain-containing protein [Desulfovibrio sp. JC022]|uniref:radical SAM/SPASM domain-containing protein n=1 Tax=Desulfovibrio sp. JC022 TaxID=2593642 RepID=UPI001D71EB29|nr:radical SAM protein [Desulfovibrio sp. JC022]NDV22108.1 radical SAM protein [Desulfovibrio sp. JC022]